MATAVSMPLPDEDSPTGSFAKWCWPWLLSTASHLVIVISLALLLEKQRGAGDYVERGSGMSLRSIQVIPGGSGDGTSGDEPQYFADDDSNITESTDRQANSTALSEPTIKLHAQGELAALVDEVAPIDFDALAPSAIKSQASGFNSAPADVPDAAGMIRSGSSKSAGGKGRGSGSGTGIGDGSGPVGLGRALEKGAARTGIFGTEGTGFKFVYVFDRSGSMDGHGGTPLAAAKEELIHSLHELDKIHQFQIIFYNEHPRVFTFSGNDGRLAFATEQNRRLAERFVNGITADGATQHEEAISLALRMNPDVIFFLTDADEPTLSAKQLARIVRLNNGTRINAIEFGYGPKADDDNFLAKLARQNGGQHVYVNVSQLSK